MLGLPWEDVFFANEVEGILMGLTGLWMMQTGHANPPKIPNLLRLKFQEASWYNVLKS